MKHQFSTMRFSMLTFDTESYIYRDQVAIFTSGERYWASGGAGAYGAELVDADPLQRSTVGQYLRDCGYRVIEATDAAEAITALTHQDIEILVTDIALRDESGFQLSAKAREIRPDLKVVVTHSAERTAKIAGDLCDDGPLDHPYHPQ